MEAMLIEAGKQAAIAYGSQKLSQELNKATGQTQQSGFQPGQFSGAVEGAGGNILKAVEQQKAANIMQKAPGVTTPPPVTDRPYEEQLNKILGVVA